MKPSLPVPRFRLVDGLVVAAIALLSLKALGMFSGEGGAGQSASLDADPAPGFAQVLAHARTNYAPEDPTTTGSVPEKPKEATRSPEAATSVPIAPAPPLIGPSPTERALVDRLGERREELQQRVREIEMREKLLQDSERKLDERTGQEKAAEEERRSTAARDGGAPGLKTLVTMYENMKPKEAARVFERLPMDTLLPLVGGMNARKASEVLAAMSPESAEKLTVALAKKARGEGAGERGGPASQPLPPGELSAIEPALPRR
ncbi:MAG: hypothetical protein JWR08_1463 [Enterovirga sp.]|nr:hypothetical protein [Enterovirga sp.]